MDNGFKPWRPDVDWLAPEETSIQPMLGRLAFTRAGPNWGYPLRFGLITITNEDADIIVRAMMPDACPEQRDGRS